MGSGSFPRTDRIVAFAEAHQFPVIANATSIRVSRLTYPSLAVLDDGNIPQGALAAAEILRSVELLSPLYGRLELERLAQLAKLAEAFHVVYHRDPALAKGNFHPIAGVLGLSFYYGAFVPRRGEHDGLEVLRALLLRAITPGKFDQSVAATTRRIRDVLTIDPTYRFEEESSPRLAEQWRPSIHPSELAALLTPYFDGQPEPAEVFAHQALRPATDAEPRRRTQSSKPSEPSPPSSSDSDTPTTTHLPSLAPKESFSAHPTCPTGLFSAPRYTPPPASLDAPPADEIPSEDLEGFQHVLALDFFQDENEPLEIEPQERLETAAFEFEQTTRHHLEGALLPDTDRTLTTTETARIWRLLIRNVESSTQHDPLEAVATVCASLMLITGRRRDECLYAMTNFFRGMRGEVHEALHVDCDSWTATIPTLPPLHNLPGDWFHAVASELTLPLPDVLSQCLSMLRESVTPHTIDSIGRSDEWQACWRQVRQQLRNDCPRFTETRCMHTLPVVTFLQTGHLRDAQWLSGSSLEHSTASGHYYATPSDRVESIYCDALASLGINVEKSATETGQRVGAPRAAIRWACAREAVAALVDRTEKTVRLTKAPLQTVADGVAALGVYLATLFGVCTAHRFTAAIAEVTRRSFVTDSNESTSWSLCLVADKSANPELDARVCVLPGLFTRQFNAYLRQLERLERSLARRKIRNSALLDHVRAALSGDGPLWFSIAGEATNVSMLRLNRTALTTAWPEWAVPLPLLRHLFASNAHAFGLRGSDIALQMGHSIDGEIFSACDPDSPSEFAERISHGLEAYAEALGFRTIGVARRHDPPAPLASRSTEEILSTHAQLSAARRIRRSQKLPDPNDNERQRGNELVGSLAEQAVHAASSEWVVDPVAIQSLLHETRNEPTPVQQAVRDEVAELVARQQKAQTGTKRRRPYIPPLRPAYTGYSTFAQVHFDALVWSRTLETQALTVLKRGLSQDDSEALLASITLLLALYGAGSTTARLLKLLDPGLELHVFTGFEAGVIADVPLGKSPRASCEAQLLTGDLVTLVTYVQRSREAAATARQIESALSLQPELRDYVHKRSPGLLADLLTLIGLARQVYTSGTRSAWERGELDSVGPSLDRVAPLLSAFIEPVGESEPVWLASGRETPSRGTGLSEYRQLRRLAHRLAVGRGGSGTRRELSEFCRELKRRFGGASLISLLGDLLIYLRVERRLADSTAYEYLTAIGMRLIKQVGAGDIYTIEIDDIERALRIIAVEMRSGAARRGVGAVAPATVHFVEVLDRAGVEIDLARIFDGLEFDAERNPGYIAAQHEIDATESHLTNKTDQALRTLRIDPAADTATIAEAGARIQMATGLRLGEVAGLMRLDVHLDDRLSINVRAIKRRSLKTLASRRVVSVPIDNDDRARLRELRDRLGDRAHDTGDLLLAPDIGTDVPSIARMISSGFRSAASQTMGGRAARGHIARHNAATVAILATHPEASTIAIKKLKPLAHFEPTSDRLKALERLPARLQFRYLSRQLGHGTPRTTLVWYAHALPLLHAQAGPWGGLSRQNEALLIGRRASDIERWRVRRGGALLYDDTARLCRWNPAWVLATPHTCVESPSFAKFEPEPSTENLSDLSAELTAWAALLVRKGIDEYTAAHHLRLTHERYRAIVNVIGERDRGLRLRYLTGRRPRTRSHLRIPRAHDLRRCFRDLDTMLNRGALDSEVLQRWTLLQLERDTNSLFFSKETLVLADTLRKHQRVYTAPREMHADALGLQPADRRLVLLVVSVVSWVRREVGSRG